MANISAHCMDCDGSEITQAVRMPVQTIEVSRLDRLDDTINQIAHGCQSSGLPLLRIIRTDSLLCTVASLDLPWPRQDSIFVGILRAEIGHKNLFNSDALVAVRAGRRRQLRCRPAMQADKA
jgi:hypothetical protein